MHVCFTTTSTPSSSAIAMSTVDDWNIMSERCAIIVQPNITMAVDFLDEAKIPVHHAVSVAHTHG